ncbi:MAG: hypothetical protein ABSG43_29320 [Solirubrobacteraceae bacterium]|jgi:hypothetical protein
MSIFVEQTVRRCSCALADLVGLRDEQGRRIGHPHCDRQQVAIRLERSHRHLPMSYCRGLETGHNACSVLGVRWNPSATTTAAGVESFVHEQLDGRVERPS